MSTQKSRPARFEHTTLEASHSAGSASNSSVLAQSSWMFAPVSHAGPSLAGPLSWSHWAEPLSPRPHAVTAGGPLEQIATTRDRSDYLWYRRR
jgi:hypothetical protein